MKRVFSFQLAKYKMATGKKRTEIHFLTHAHTALVYFQARAWPAHLCLNSSTVFSLTYFTWCAVCACVYIRS
jgi:hypothetical protein